jgi:hypothetical protein
MTFHLITCQDQFNSEIQDPQMLLCRVIDVQCRYKYFVHVTARFVGTCSLIRNYCQFEMKLLSIWEMKINLFYQMNHLSLYVVSDQNAVVPPGRPTFKAENSFSENLGVYSNRLSTKYIPRKGEGPRIWVYMATIFSSQQ